MHGASIWQALDANAFYILGIGFVVSLMIWGRRKLVDNRADQDTDTDPYLAADIREALNPDIIPVARRGSIGRTE